MGDIIPFKKIRPSEKGRSKTLCRRGFHKWEICTQKRFDVKLGKLVTAFRCKRCGAEKNKAV